LQQHNSCKFFVQDTNKSTSQKYECLNVTTLQKESSEGPSERNQWDEVLTTIPNTTFYFPSLHQFFIEFFNNSIL